MLQLSVKTLDSLTHNFTDLSDEISVVEFKSHISSTVTLPPEQQRLIFRGRVLQDDKKLRDYNVESGQVIHLVARNPTESTPANDHPQPQTNAHNSGGGGRNNAIIMGTIGTLEFPTPQQGNTTTRRRNSAAVRLQVANQCLTRASNLLRTLEDDVIMLSPQERERQGTVATEEEEELTLDSADLQHAATTATVMASMQQHSSPRHGTGNGGGSNRVSNDPSPTPETGSNGPPPAAESGYATPNSSTEVSTPRTESPMLHELSTAIRDFMALNTRLMPYLQTVQRWLGENGDVSQNHAAVQYTYDTVSSILHSVSHTVHALSDITVDFSIPPAQRRLRGPTTVWVLEQSPVMRATIPIGVQVGVETSRAGFPPAPPAMRQQIIAQGLIPGGVADGGAQIQQVISNLIQGVMSGQIPTQPQQQSTTAGPTPPNVNNNNNPPQAGNSFEIDIGRMLQGQGIPMRIPLNINTTQPPRPNPPPTAVVAPQGTADTRSTSNATQSSAPQQPNLNQGQPMGGISWNSLQSLPPPRMPTLEHIILQCRSHHYPNPSGPSPQPRPENLVGFLSEETNIPVGEEVQVFETVAAFMQGLNLVHPIFTQYVKSTILRGRDCNNSGHVTTAVKVYARKVVDWIVASIASSRRESFDKVHLTSNLMEVVTQLMSKATQLILVTPPTAPITPKLGTLLNEWMPKILETLENTFKRPEHLRIFKGIIHLIVCTCFPGTSVMFTTRLAAGIADFLITCQPSPQEETEVTPDTNTIESEISMEIDVEFGEVTEDGGRSSDTVGSMQVEPQGSVSTETINVPSTSLASSVPSFEIPSTSKTITTSTKNEASEHPQRQVGSGDIILESDDDEEDLESQLDTMTSSLFRDVPQHWHETLLRDIQRQQGLREGSMPEPSAGFNSLFPPKK